MTNSQIIANVLAEMGIEEEAHTAAFWNSRSYHIIKGQHAAAVCWLWKVKNGKGKRIEDQEPQENAEEVPEGWVKVKSYLFLRSQVEPVKKGNRANESIQTYEVEMDAYRHPQLIREKDVPYCAGPIDMPYKAADFFNAAFRLEAKAEEHLVMLALSEKRKALGAFVVTHGGVASCLACAREIYCRALLTNSSYVLIAHNHPSGDITPSQADIEVTRKIAEAGKIIGIELSDSIIIGENKYFSFLEDGILRDE